MHFSPRIHDGRDQGDPFILEAAPGSDFRYYCFTTAGGDARSGYAFDVYGSQDLLGWVHIRRALRADPSKEYWAPCVWKQQGSAGYTMLYSHGFGRGIAGNIGHRIFTAHSDLPEGPYEPTGVLTPRAIDFAIDPDISRGEDGTLVLTFASDFNDGEPKGTGIWEAKLSEDLQALVTEPHPVIRPQYDWQVFNPERSMPWKRLDGVDWSRGDRVRWYCVEAPASILSPRGSRIVLYSAGNFEGAYGIGLVRRGGDGIYQDLTRFPDECLVQTEPSRGFYGPGHGAFITDPGGRTLLAFHARFGSPNASRQLCLASLHWDNDLPTLRPFPAS